MPHDWKPMGAVGPGVNEIRVHTGREHRVFYVAKFADAVYVLHAFEKKGQRTRLPTARSAGAAISQWFDDAARRDLE